jgi:hypothetical protein
MKKIILVLSMAGLFGCTDKPQQNNIDHSIQPPVSSSEKQISTEVSSDDAKQFAVQLLKKINDDEKFVLEAYELKEQPVLEKYFYDIQAYMQPIPDDFTKSYWPDSDSLSPYTKCDTALRDLQLYASALSHQLKEDTASMRKIVRQEEEDYRNSKAKCEERVNLTYEQAVAADEAE